MFFVQFFLCFLSYLIDFSECLSITFNFCISFNAYVVFVFFSITFHTFPNPPLPITYLNSKRFRVTIVRDDIYELTSFSVWWPIFTSCHFLPHYIKILLLFLYFLFFNRCIPLLNSPPLLYYYLLICIVKINHIKSSNVYDNTCISIPLILSLRSIIKN